jgi:hypothetical protein
MGLMNDLVWWATYNSEAASLVAGMVACGIWSAGYVCVSEWRRNYKSNIEEREHIRPLDKK